MPGASILIRIDRTRLARLADWLTVAVAVSLPWSTSATGILIVLWLLALVPTLDWTDIRRKLMTPAGGLPVLLFLLGALGMLWADVALLERWKGLDSFFKLLAIPLLLVQFRRTERGGSVFVGYLVSCLVLLAVSTAVMAIPGMPFVQLHYDNVLVKNAPTQSGEFVTCMFGLLYFAMDSYKRGRRPLLFWSLAAMSALLADVIYIATGRTALVVIPVLLVAFALKQFSAKGTLIVLIGAILVGAIAWVSSPYLRQRTTGVWGEIQRYETRDERNSSGERIEFAKKSLAFIAQAPVFGHGTGTIPRLFERAAIGQTGARSVATTNPHNQTLAVAIQLGLVGAGVLWAMWIAHLLLVRGHGLAEWIGLVVVIQNIIGSLFNSHLFDFNQGWVYVFGVGVAGGMALKNWAAKKAAGAAP